MTTVFHCGLINFPLLFYNLSSITHFDLNLLTNNWHLLFRGVVIAQPLTSKTEKCVQN